jgi:hypothetical protein
MKLNYLLVAKAKKHPIEDAHKIVQALGMYMNACELSEHPSLDIEGKKFWTRKAKNGKKN